MFPGVLSDIWIAPSAQYVLGHGGHEGPQGTQEFVVEKDGAGFELNMHFLSCDLCVPWCSL